MLISPVPCNVEIEKYILGCMFLEKDCHSYLPDMSADDFADENNKALYGAINNLWLKKQPVDIIGISQSNPNLMAYAANISAEVPTTAAMSSHFDTLKQYTYRRIVIKSANNVRDMALNGVYDNVNDLKNDVLAAMSIGNDVAKSKKHDMASLIMKTYEEIERRYKDKHEGRLYYGYPELDRHTAGLHKRELSIIAARPSQGKSALALQILYNLAKRGNHCLLVSREMSDTQMCERLMSNVSMINSQRIRFAKTMTESDWYELSQAAGIISELPLYINDFAISVQEIRSFCRELKDKNCLDVLAVDYLQLCKTKIKTQSREREVAEMSWEFKQMANEFNIPVIVLSQLNRAATADKEPTLNTLRESGAIEQDADVVMFIHQEEEDKKKDILDVKIIISKQRSGPTGAVTLKYIKPNFRFAEVANENTNLT
jgi:replicative DNA helicase